ncbi:hypothetical protein [Calothrix sp. NIES-2098]|uniref:hypothetical protein n=1 Tax=Calothrix sp. NIES-2098 TaxID=1954171 RepID=UPI0030DCF38C
MPSCQPPQERVTDPDRISSSKKLNIHLSETPSCRVLNEVKPSNRKGVRIATLPCGKDFGVKRTYTAGFTLRTLPCGNDYSARTPSANVERECQGQTQ